MSNSRTHGIFGALLKEKGGLTEARSGGGIPVTSSDDDSADASTITRGHIAVDIFEEEGYLIVKAPIAGVKLSDLDIDVAENELTIRGRRSQTDDISSEQYILQECYWGEFERKVTLPCTVNPTKVKATFSKDNVLKVFVPKEAGRKVKIVKINEGG